MPDRSGDLSSPLLTASGAEYRMVVPAGAAGDLPVLLPSPPRVRHAGQLTIK